jgi:hypothetical protein
MYTTHGTTHNYKITEAIETKSPEIHEVVWAETNVAVVSLSSAAKEMHSGTLLTQSLGVCRHFSL